jgi:UDP:flavonoid glycosyltransferase YjiC (YdhE family)
MSKALVEFLAAGPPPIIFTLGSTAVWVARDFFTQSIEAATQLGKRAVLLIGDERNRLPELPITFSLRTMRRTNRCFRTRALWCTLEVPVQLPRHCWRSAHTHRSFCFRSI